MRRRVSKRALVARGERLEQARRRRESSRGQVGQSSGQTHKPLLSSSQLPSLNLYDEMHLKGKRKVCVHRGLGGLGDILMITPVLCQLKKDFPDAELTFSAPKSYHPLLVNAPFIDVLIEAESFSPAGWEAWADITHVCIRYERAGPPALHRTKLWARHLGLPGVDDPLPFYEIEDKERVWAKRRLDRMGAKGRLVALHTASMDAQRCWLPERYIELIELAPDDIDFIIFDQNRVCPELNGHLRCHDVSNTSFRQMAALIEQCEHFVGPDSGPMHLAGTLGVLGTIIMGSIPPQVRLAHYPHQAVRAEHLDCLGCWYQKCPLQHRCMSDVSAMMVWQRVEHALS